jgi:hypothetical protein
MIFMLKDKIKVKIKVFKVKYDFYETTRFTRN